MIIYSVKADLLEGVDGGLDHGAGVGGVQVAQDVHQVVGVLPLAQKIRRLLLNFLQLVKKGQE